MLATTTIHNRHNVADTHIILAVDQSIHHIQSFRVWYVRVRMERKKKICTNITQWISEANIRFFFVKYNAVNPLSSIFVGSTTCANGERVWIDDAFNLCRCFLFLSLFGMRLYAIYSTLKKIFIGTCCV